MMEFIMKHLHIHIDNKLERIEMKLSELLAQNVSIKGTLSAAEAKILAKIANLQAALDKVSAELLDATLTEAQVQSIMDLQAAAAELNDIVPDENTG